MSCMFLFCKVQYSSPFCRMDWYVAFSGSVNWKLLRTSSVSEPAIVRSLATFWLLPFFWHIAFRCRMKHCLQFPLHISTKIQPGGGCFIAPLSIKGIFLVCFTPGTMHCSWNQSEWRNPTNVLLRSLLGSPWRQRRHALWQCLKYYPMFHFRSPYTSFLSLSIIGSYTYDPIFKSTEHSFGKPLHFGHIYMAECSLQHNFCTPWQR